MASLNSPGLSLASSEIRSQTTSEHPAEADRTALSSSFMKCPHPAYIKTEVRTSLVSPREADKLGDLRRNGCRSAQQLYQDLGLHVANYLSLIESVAIAHRSRKPVLQRRNIPCLLSVQVCNAYQCVLRKKNMCSVRGKQLKIMSTM